MPSSYTIGRHYEGLVQELVTSGLYASASEVLRYGLRMIEEREQIRKAKLELRAALDEMARVGIDVEATISNLEIWARSLREL